MEWIKIVLKERRKLQKTTISCEKDRTGRVDNDANNLEIAGTQLFYMDLKTI